MVVGVVVAALLVGAAVLVSTSMLGLSVVHFVGASATLGLGLALLLTVRVSPLTTGLSAAVVALGVVHAVVAMTSLADLGAYYRP